MDTTYSPLLVSVLYGDNGSTFQEYETFQIGEINDWYTLKTEVNGEPLKAFSLQVVISEMHHSGKNTRLRQVEIISPKEFSSTPQNPFSYTDPFLNTFLSIR